MLERADEKIRRYKAIKQKIAELKAEVDSIEAEFLKAMESDLEDTKYKSVSYSDGEGNKVTATEAESLKVIYPSFLKKHFRGGVQRRSYRRGKLARFRQELRVCLSRCITVSMSAAVR